MSAVDEYPAKNTYRDQREAASYDAKRFHCWRGALVNHREMRLMIEGLDLLRGSDANCTVLDVPAGTGRLADALIASGYTVTAADISQEMLTEAERLHHLSASGHFAGEVVCDAEHLPFKDGSFDAVACLRLAGHLPQVVLETVLQESMRVARRGLVVMVVRDTPLIRLKHFLQRKKSRAEIGRTWFPMKRRETEAALLRHGWTVLRRRVLYPALAESVVYVIACTQAQAAPQDR